MTCHQESHRLWEVNVKSVAGLGWDVRRRRTKAEGVSAAGGELDTAECGRHDVDSEVCIRGSGRF